MTKTDPRINAPPLGAILETALYVDDLVVARAFYANVLKLDLITEAPGRHVFFRVGQGMLLLFDPIVTAHPPDAEEALPVPPHGATGAGHACFAVNRADLDQWRKALEQQNIPVEADFIWPNGARSLYFRDPAGNSLELAEPGLWFNNGT
ncbi:MAG: VOC family protein [Rhodobacterales bacterium]